MADEGRPQEPHLPRAVRAIHSLGRRARQAPRRLVAGTVLGMGAYIAALHFSSGNRPEHGIMFVVVLALLLWSDTTRRFFLGMLPFLLFGIVYDLMHITEPLVRYLHVHVDEPYLFEKTYFGIATAQGIVTPNELFRTHHWPAVDFVTGLSYILFIYWSLGFAAYLALFRRNEAGRRLLSRFGWTFLVLNVAGFATYYLYPAAPPWYVAEYGLGPANLAAHSSAAGAARWDALTGIPYFASFYGRSADVFGAIPSLHVAYPLLTFLCGLELRKRWLDVTSFTLFAIVSFAAVYLDHHYVLDVLLGYGYTFAAYGASVLVERRRAAAAAAAPVEA